MSNENNNAANIITAGADNYGIDDFDPSTADFGDELESDVIEGEVVDNTPTDADELPDDAVPNDTVEDDVDEDADEATDSDDDGDDADGSDADSDDSADDTVDNEPAEEEKPRSRSQDRIRQLNEKLKRAEERLAELESKPKAPEKPAEPEYDFEKREQDYIDAVINGEVKEAQAIRKEISEKQREEFLREVDERAQKAETNATTRTREDIQLNATAEAIASEYDALNDEHEGFDESIVDEVLELRDLYAKGRGISMAQALQEAVETIAPKYGLQKNSQKSAAPKPPAPKKPNKRQVEKNSKAAAQPPRMDGGSNTADDNSVDIMNMTEAEFDQLDEKTLAQLRGDTF